MGGKKACCPALKHPRPTIAVFIDSAPYDIDIEEKKMKS